jgi:hypothetical protein
MRTKAMLKGSPAAAQRIENLSYTSLMPCDTLKAAVGRTCAATVQAERKKQVDFFPAIL